MIAVDGKDCVFCAVVLPGEDEKEEVVRKSLVTAKQSQKLAPAGFACEKNDSVAFYWSPLL